MTKHLRIAIAVAALLTVGAAHAYKLTKVGGDRIDVHCESGAFVGSMFWNGTRWSDGLRSDPDPDVVAKQMVAAQGSACL